MPQTVLSLPPILQWKTREFSRWFLNVWDFSLHHVVKTGSRAHPASYVMGIEGYFSGRIKQPGREADHSPPTSVEIKNTWIYTPTPAYDFMMSWLLKHKDKFTCFQRLCSNSNQTPVASKSISADPPKMCQSIKRCNGDSSYSVFRRGQFGSLLKYRPFSLRLLVVFITPSRQMLYS
jgi:hypothetical protein